MFRRNAATNHEHRPRNAAALDKPSAKAASIVDARRPEFASARDAKYLGKRNQDGTSPALCRQDEPSDGVRRQCRHISREGTEDPEDLQGIC